jgi:hypothetical protein
MKLKKSKLKSKSKKDIAIVVSGKGSESKSIVKPKFDLFPKIWGKITDSIYNKKKLEIENIKKKQTPYVVYQPKSMVDIKGMIKKREYFKKQSSVLLINMELVNGKSRSFFIYIEADCQSFIHKDKRYIIDEDLKYENISSGCYSLDYHELFALPYRRQFPLNAMTKKLEAQAQDFLDNIDDNPEVNDKVKSVFKDLPKHDVKYLVNPSLSEKFMTSKIIEKIINSQFMLEIFNKIFWGIVIVGVVGVICFILNLIIVFKV